VVLDYGLLGDALMEQGRLAEAVAAYQRMVDLKPFYQSYTRAAHARWMKGDLDGALSAMRRAVESASPRDPESSAWAWTRVALYELQANRLPAARQAADAALRYEPEYAAALLAKGRILLAEKNRSEALTALARATTAWIAVIIGVAWLTWPVWTSPFINITLARWLTPAHPLMAINSVVMNYGAWLQQPLMYRYSSLGQDVPYLPPQSIWPCVLVHGAIALLLLAPEWWRARGRWQRREAAAGSTAAPSASP